MRSTSVILATLVVVVLCGGFAHALFPVDKHFGEHVKTVLPDGRLHYKFVPKVSGNQFPTTGTSALLPKVSDESHVEFSGKSEIIMQSHWRIFDVVEHSDHNKALFHESGDINLRVSLFDVSSDLLNALKTAPNSVILTAEAADLQAHGLPIFRKVLAVHDFSKENYGEILLVTAKASYEELFDEADIHFNIAHPNLTHFHSEEDNLMMFEDQIIDRGVSFELPPQSHGAHMVPRHPKLVYPKQTHSQKAPDMYSAMAQHQKKNALRLQNGEDSVSFFEEFTALEARENSREAVPKWGWAKKLIKKARKVVKKVRKVVKKVVKKARTVISKAKTVFKSISRSISSVTSRVVSSIGKGFTGAFNAIKNFLSINVNWKKSLSKTFKLSKSRKLGRIMVTGSITFTAGVTMKIQITKNKLQLVHVSAYGNLHLYGGASMAWKWKGYDQSQSVLYTIKAPRIKFVIGPVPVWIDPSVPVLATYNVKFGGKATYSAGFGIKAGCRAGVEWTRRRGFTQIATRSFSRYQAIKYSKTITATISAGAAAQVKFMLYSFVGGSAQIDAGISATLTATIFTSRYTKCQIKIVAGWYIRFSALISIEIKIAGISIYEKDFGPLFLYQLNYPLYSLCTTYAKLAKKAIKGLTGTAYVAMSEEEVAFPEHRDAIVLADDDTSANTEDPSDDDNGKIWQATVDCPNGDSFTFSTNAIFYDNLTLFQVVLSRNITNVTDGTYTLANQAAIYWLDSNVSIGLKDRILILSPDDDGMVELEFSKYDTEALTGYAAGDAQLPSLNLSYIEIEVDAATVDKMSFSHPALCVTKAVSDSMNTTDADPATPPPNSETDKVFRSLDRQIAPAFLTLVTDAVIIVLILAILEWIFAWQAPRIMGKYYPSVPSKAIGREKVWALSAVILTVFCFVLFLSGGSRNYAQILGSRVETNYTGPQQSGFSAALSVPSTPSDNAPKSSLLKASGLETVVWTFHGASIDVGTCPQYYPCSPNCRDLCDWKRGVSWSDAKWPYCPGSASDVPQGDCSMFAHDAISHTFWALFFLIVGIIPPVLYFLCVYRRLPIAHGSLMCVGLNLQLLNMRIRSFMKEVQDDYFEPSVGMIIPFQLHFDTEALGLMQAACTCLFILIGLFAIVSIVEMVMASQEELERQSFHKNFEGSETAMNSTPEFDPVSKDSTTVSVVGEDGEEKQGQFVL